MHIAFNIWQTTFGGGRLWEVEKSMVQSLDEQGIEPQIAPNAIICGLAKYSLAPV